MGSSSSVEPPMIELDSRGCWGLWHDSVNPTNQDTRTAKEAKGACGVEVAQGPFLLGTAIRHCD